MLSKLKCKIGWHKWVDIAFGYPRYKNWPILVEKCKCCGLVRKEYCNMFADPRPDHYPINQDVIHYFRETDG